jgi:hypothetical protein
VSIEIAGDEMKKHHVGSDPSNRIEDGRFAESSNPRDDF